MQEEQQTHPKHPWPNYPWYVVGLLALAYAVSYLDRLIISLMVEPIKADLGLSDTQISLLIGLSFALFYTTCAIPFAWLADRYNRRNIIVSGITIWCLMTAACGFARSFLFLFIARMGVGLGEAALVPAGNSMIADYFRKDQLGRALGIFTSGIALGAGLALVLGGQVLSWIGPTKVYEISGLGSFAGWQVTFIVLGVVGLGVALLMMTVREPARDHDRDGVAANPQATIKQTIVYFREQANVYVPLFVGYAFAQTCFFAITGWIPTLFIRVYEWDVARFGTAYGLLIGICGVIAVIGSGWVSDTLFKRGIKDAHWRVIIAAFCVLPGYMLLPFFKTGESTLALLAFANLGAFAAATAAPAAILLSTPNRFRAMATALFFFTINIIGMTSGPFFVAVLTEHVFKSPNSIALSLAVVSGVSWVFAMSFIVYGMRAYRRRISEVLEENPA